MEQSTQQQQAPQEGEPNVDALTQAAKGSQQQQAPEAPKLPEGLDEGKFKEALQAFGFEGPDNLREAAKLKPQYEEMRSKYTQLSQQLQEQKAQSELSPFANPMVERINKFFKEGKDEGDVRRFLQVQAMDTDNLDYGDAVKQRMRMEYPHLEASEIEAAFEDRYGQMPKEDDEDAEKKRARIMAKIKMDGQEAKRWLEEQKVSFDNPEAQQQAAEQKQKAERFQKAWGSVAQAIAANETQLKWGAEDNKIGGAYQFEYTPKIGEQEQKQIASMVRDYAVQNNLPLNEESLPALNEYKEAVLWNMYRDDYLKHMAMDMYASLQERFVKQAPAGKAVPKGSEGSRNPKPTPQPKKQVKPKRGYM